MVSTQVKHFLHFKNVSRPSISARLNHNANELSKLLVLKNLCGLDGCFSQVLLAKEEKPEAESENAHKRTLKIFFFLFHQGLQNTLRSIFITSSSKDQTNG